MIIEEMTTQESFGFLARGNLGRLGCARDNQPYVVPIHFAYDSRSIYAFSTFGKKIDWMRTNPLVCIEVDEIQDDRHWSMVIVSGHFEELPDTKECHRSRNIAWQLLQRHANWWEPGYVKTVLHGTERPLEPVFFRVTVEKITGHRAIPDEVSLYRTSRIGTKE